MQGEVALGGVINFQVLHLLPWNQLPEQLAVGPKRYRPVQKQSQPGPHLGDVIGPSQFHHAAQQQQHPGGHSGQHTHVLAQRVSGDALYFVLPLVE